MNKKKIGALLVGATLLVGAMGSFAYFTAGTSDIKGHEGNALQAITITNGEVVISAKGANQGANVTDWTYDVAKLSTDNNNNLADGIQYSFGEGDNKVEYTKTVKDFEDENRSPDINAVNKLPNGKGTLSRAVIGSYFEEMEIQNARPGDAIVLGTAVSEQGSVGGLIVTNESNLTVKMQLVIKNDEFSREQLKKMKAAGWKMYVGGQEVDFVKPEGSENYQEENNIIINLGVVSPKSESTTGESTTGESTTGESTIMPDIRFELPLETGNGYQGKEDGTAGKVEGIDLSQIIEIQATQENNPGWNQDGSGNRITP